MRKFYLIPDPIWDLNFYVKLAARRTRRALRLYLMYLFR